MLVRPLIALMLSLLTILPPATANGDRPSSLPVRAQIQSHGLRLSLGMPHGPFAWNSIIPVTARVVNVSNRVVLIGSTWEAGLCYVTGPVAEVQQRNGNTVFPPSVSNAPTLPCPGPSPGRPLQPGAQMTASGYVILRAAHVRATLTLVQGPGTVAVSTPAVTVTLHLMPAPRVTLHTNGTVFATLTRPPAAPGPMLVSEWWRCAARPGTGAADIPSRPPALAAVRGTRLTPHLAQKLCSRLLEWHAVTGWSGFPAARIDYTPPSAK